MTKSHYFSHEIQNLLISIENEFKEKFWFIWGVTDNSTHAQQILLYGSKKKASDSGSQKKFTEIIYFARSRDWNS